MKQGTTELVKFKRLMRELGKINPGAGTEWGAVGILEKLWQVTRREAPRGDIGRVENQDIAAAMGWTDDADALIAALVDCRWLDAHEDPRVRLVVHGWSEHSDDTNHAAVAKMRAWFVDGAEPRLTRLYSKDRDEAAKFYAANRHDTPRCSLEPPESSKVPSHAMPKPSHAHTGARARGDFSDPFEDADGFDWQPYHWGFNVWIGEANTVNGNQWLDVKAQLETAREHDMLPPPEDWQAWCRKRREEYHREKGQWPLYAAPLLAKMREQHNDLAESRRKAAAKNGAGP